jgi:hypothetical protein
MAKFRYTLRREPEVELGYMLGSIAGPRIIAKERLDLASTHLGRSSRSSTINCHQRTRKDVGICQ